MGLPAINSLANMEYLLYPTGSGFNTYCPSYANGYKANVDLYNNPYGYGYNNPFGNYNYTAQADATRVSNNTEMYNQLLSNGIDPKNVAYEPSAADRIAQASQQAVSAVQNADIDTVANYAAKTKETAQSWSGLPLSATMFAFMECPQAMKHFWNSGKAIKMTDKVFEPIMETLWKTDSQLIQKAYGQMHAINRAAGSKIPLIGGWFSKPIEEGTRAQLEKIMTDAIASGDKTKILEATETLKAARGMDGYIPSAWNWLKNNTWNKAKEAFGFTAKEAKNYTPMERIANKQTQIAEAVKTGSNASTGLSATKLLSEGIKSGKVMALFSLLIDAPKIITAFTHKDGGIGSGVTQLVQSGSRAFIDGVGWAVGAAVGKAIGVKASAAIGTMICPGVGTAVGAALGFIGAAAGSIAANKLGHLLMPTDEVTKLETNAQKQTAQGQAQLVQMVAQKVQSGEKVPDNVVQAAQRMVA